MKEIAIISGKGGTGKTSLVLSMIPFFDNLVIADCDVDAPDTHIILDPEFISTDDFVGLQRPIIDYSKCSNCGLCYQSCKFNAITPEIEIKSSMCEGCGVCEYVCPEDAITMNDYVVGKIFHRKTAYGPLIDARLTPGEESSGKLVTEVRNRSKQIADEINAETILIDGSPGVACNVISTITGVHKAVIVTEPTQSGLHDLKRVIKLSRIFHSTVFVVINKYDINTDMSNKIEEYCKEEDLPLVLKIPFEPKMVQAISNKLLPSKADIPFFQSEDWKNFIDIMKG
jgi:MinD superfamily P-loop ATPase